MKIFLFEINPLKIHYSDVSSGNYNRAGSLWVPERVFNVFDLISNVSGVIVGMGL